LWTDFLALPPAPQLGVRAAWSGRPPDYGMVGRAGCGPAANGGSEVAAPKGWLVRRRDWILDRR